MPVRALVVVTALLLGSACSSPEPTARVVEGGGATAGGSADGAGDLAADFTYEADYGTPTGTSCPVQSIQFTDASTGGPETWSWDFGDGGTSTEPDPLLTTAVGEATLTVTRGDETDSVTKPIQLVVC